MATLSETSPVSVPALAAAKGREKIAMLTAYDAPSARLLDEAGVDVLLVGDSVEMTVYGESSTLSATMDSMIRHSRAVSRAAKRALVVGDMPFLLRSGGHGGGRAQRRAVSLGGRLRRREGRRRPPHPAGRLGDSRRGHPRHGAHRPHAEAPSASSADTRSRGATRGRRTRFWRTRRRSPKRAASRWSSSACRKRSRPRSRARDPHPHARHRRGRRLRRAGAGVPRRDGLEPGLQAEVRAAVRRHCIRHRSGRARLHARREGRRIPERRRVVLREKPPALRRVY